MEKSQILRGSVELVVLSLLGRKEMYGYQISQALKSADDGVLGVGEGTLYPMLYRMERAGHIKGRWAKGTGKRRIRYYKITPEGRKDLKERSAYWKKVTRVMQKMI